LTPYTLFFATFFSSFFVLVIPLAWAARLDRFHRASSFHFISGNIKSMFLYLKNILEKNWFLYF
jgi:hypothetical protein